MSLQSELDTFKAGWLGRVGTETAQLVADDIEALKSLAAQARKAGDIFPSLALPRGDGQMVDVGAITARGPAVITFYRGGWCPYCNLELRAFQALLPEIQSLGATLIAVSPETPDHTVATAEKNGVAFTVLSDAKGALAMALGIQFELAPAIKALYQKFGHDLASRNDDPRWALPMPATYVVEKGGRIAAAFVDPDYRRRMEPTEALAALRAIVAKAAA
jgi:peroxiredoxin